jgi:hypothetical protein
MVRRNRADHLRQYFYLNNCFIMINLNFFGVCHGTRRGWLRR